MTVLVHAGVVAIFAAWLIATVVKQMRTSWAIAVHRHDSFSLVPQWTFFAPNPGRADLHVLFRDQHADGSFSPWHEVDSAAGRTSRSSLWNPEKRRKKAVHDAVGSLVAVPGEPGPEIMVSRAYLMILSMVCSATVPPDARYRQFVVVATEQTAPDAPPKLRLKSALHPL